GERNHVHSSSTTANCWACASTANTTGLSTAARTASISKYPRMVCHSPSADMKSATKARIAAVFKTDARKTSTTFEIALSTHKRREVRYTVVKTRHIPKALRPMTSLPEKVSSR